MFKPKHKGLQIVLVLWVTYRLICIDIDGDIEHAILVPGRKDIMEGHYHHHYRHHLHDPHQLHHSHHLSPHSHLHRRHHHHHRHHLYHATTPRACAINL